MSNTERAVKSNWSGFIPENGTHTSNKRIEFLEVAKNAHEEVSWRKFLGDVLVGLKNEIAPMDLAKLLVKKGYIDSKQYVKIAASNGIDGIDAEHEYQEIKLEMRGK